MATIKALVLTALIVAVGIAAFLLAPFIGVLLGILLVFFILKEEFSEPKDDDPP